MPIQLNWLPVILLPTVSALSPNASIASILPTEYQSLDLNRDEQLESDSDKTKCPLLLSL